MKHLKKWAAVLLCAALVFTLSVPALAGDGFMNEGTFYNFESATFVNNGPFQNNGTMHNEGVFSNLGRLFGKGLAKWLKALVGSGENSMTDPSGSCGTASSNVTWAVSSDGFTLTIGGSGEIRDYSWFDIRSSRGTQDWAAFNEVIENVVIGSGVTRIGQNAFRGMQKLTNVQFQGNSVTSIGSGAFNYCSALSSITLPSSLTTIESDAFGLCMNLSTIHIPASVTTIGETAFGWCGTKSGTSGLSAITVDSTNPAYTAVDGVLYNKDMTTLHTYPGNKGATSFAVPTTVTRIGNASFSSAVHLEKLTIPEGVTAIGDYAFDGCLAMTSLCFDGEKTQWGNVSKGANALADTVKVFCLRGTVGTNLTWTINTAGTLTISGTGEMAEPEAYPWTENEPLIQSIVIGEGVTSVGSKAFQYFLNLKTVTLPSTVTKIGDNAFDTCYYMTSVTMPAGLIHIGDQAFIGCGSLTELTIPDTVLKIGSAAFFESGLTSVTIPAGVQLIANAAFAECKSLRTVTYGGTAASLAGKTLYYAVFPAGTVITTADTTSPTVTVVNGVATAVTDSTASDGASVTLNGTRYFYAEAAAGTTATYITETNYYYDLYLKSDGKIIKYAQGRNNSTPAPSGGGYSVTFDTSLSPGLMLSLNTPSAGTTYKIVLSDNGASVGTYTMNNISTGGSGSVRFSVPHAAGTYNYATVYEGTSTSPVWSGAMEYPLVIVEGAALDTGDMSVSRTETVGSDAITRYTYTLSGITQSEYAYYLRCLNSSGTYDYRPIIVSGSNGSMSDVEQFYSSSTPIAETYSYDATSGYTLTRFTGNAELTITTVP